MTGQTIINAGLFTVTYEIPHGKTRFLTIERHGAPAVVFCDEASADAMIEAIADLTEPLQEIFLDGLMRGILNCAQGYARVGPAADLDLPGGNVVALRLDPGRSE